MKGMKEMLPYKFMAITDKKTILKKVLEEYNFSMLDNRLKGKKPFFVSFLEKNCKEINLKPLVKNLEYCGESDKLDAEYMAREIENVLRKPESYLLDLYSAIYMGYLHHDSEQNTILWLKSIEKELDKHSVPNEEEIRDLLKSVNLKKYEMQSVWKSAIDTTTKVNKEKICKNYLSFFDGMYEKNTGEGEYEVASAPGGCFQYHHTLLSKEHVRLWDIERDNEDYQRYGFGKTYELLEKLKYVPEDEKFVPVENRVLAEYTLGIGYINTIYPYVKEIYEREKLEQLLEIIKISIETLPFSIRDKISLVLWEYLFKGDMGKTYIQNAIRILLEIRDSVSYLYLDTLKLCWYEYMLYAEKSDWESIGRIAHQEYELYSYNKENEAYLDWIDLVKVHDWRGIRGVDQCFFILEDFRESENQYKGNGTPFKTEYVAFKDKGGKKKVLFLEKPTNKIGETVLQKVKKRLLEECFPEDIEQLYQMYYKLRNEEFQKLKKMEEETFKKKDIKIKSNWKKLKPEKVYAWLHKYIIWCLVSSKISEDK